MFTGIPPAYHSLSTQQNACFPIPNRWDLWPQLPYRSKQRVELGNLRTKSGGDKFHFILRYDEAFTDLSTVLYPGRVHSSHITRITRQWNVEPSQLTRNVDPMLLECRAIWPRIQSTLGQRFVLAPCKGMLHAKLQFRRIGCIGSVVETLAQHWCKLCGWCAVSQQTWKIDPMRFYSWASVVDCGPALE